jgi:hypothetical protein
MGAGAWMLNAAVLKYVLGCRGGVCHGKAERGVAEQQLDSASSGSAELSKQACHARPGLVVFVRMANGEWRMAAEARRWRSKDIRQVPDHGGR